MPNWDEIFRKKPEPPRRVVNIDKDPPRKKFVQDGVLDFLDRRRGSLKPWDTDARY